MTGRELVLYILQNNLENEVVIKNGLFIAVLSDEETAIKFNVGIATVKAWRKHKHGGTKRE